MINFVVCPTPNSSQERERAGGTRYKIRRLLRFGFDSLKSGSFNYECQKTKQRECPVGVLYTYHYYIVYSHWCIYVLTIGIAVVLYLHIGVGFSVARF